MRFVYAVVVAASVLPAGLWAQQKHELDLAVTYGAQRGLASGGGGFWAQGGTAELSVMAYHGLGVAMNIGGMRAANISSSGVGLTMLTTTFGPRYTWAHRVRWRREVRLFGQGSDAAPE